MSSSVTSRLRSFLNGFKPSSIALMHRLPGLALLDVAVDAVLDEDLLQRAEVPLLLEFAEPDLELQLEQVAGLLRGAPEDLGDAEELRLAVGDHAGVRRDATPRSR